MSSSAALRTLLAETVYGGRIDNVFDQRLLESFLAYLFSSSSFDLNYLLTPHIGHATKEQKEESLVPLIAPEGKSRYATVLLYFVSPLTLQ